MKHLKPWIQTLDLKQNQEKYLVYFKWMLIAIAIAISLTIAFVTRFRIHPDESIHVSGFQYFQGRFFPPPLNADGIAYSGYGQSRVYAREIVYILYGNLANLLKIITGVEPNYLTYRLFNIVLFFITLLAIFFARTAKRIDLFGFVVLCIPQVYYIYSYANSDAWALSCILFLLIFAVQLWEKTLAAWTVIDLLILGLLTGLVLVAKQNFYVGLILPYCLLGSKILPALLTQKLAGVRQWLPAIAAFLLSVFLVAAPLQIFYVRSQGNFNTAYTQMREQRAKPRFKPSNPISRGLHLKAKGYSYGYLFERNWHKQTARSFWGLFGGMNVLVKPKQIYHYVYYATIALFLLTVVTLIRTQATRYDAFLSICLPISVLTIAVNIYAALYHSLSFDFQPQGRYLFPCIVPLAFLTVGTATLDKPAIRIAKVILLAILYGLTLYALLAIAIPKLALK